jgi:tetratricopeptide (TPR) repeat protein
MRTVVREPGGLMGSADRRLDVRPLNGPGIGVSDLVIGSATGTLAVRPIAHVEDGVSGLIETYGRTAEQLDDSLNVIVDLLPAAGGPPAVSVQAELQPLERSEHGAVRRASFDLPLATIIPGEYVARATVKAHGETAAQVLRQIDVAAGTAAMSARAPAARRFRASDVLEGEVAAKYIATLRAQPPGAATAHALHGLDLFRSERFAEAAAALQEALMLDQRNAPAAFVLGWAYEGAGDRRQAIGAWRAAAVADPTLLPAHLALADAYIRISEPALAAQVLRAGLSVLPESVELKNKLRQIENK